MTRYLKIIRDIFEIMIFFMDEIVVLYNVVDGKIYKGWWNQVVRNGGDIRDGEIEVGE